MPGDFTQLGQLVEKSAAKEDDDFSSLIAPKFDPIYIVVTLGREGGRREVKASKNCRIYVGRKKWQGKQGWNKRDLIILNGPHHIRKISSSSKPST